MDSMYFSWIDKPVEIDKDIQLPQFVYKHHALFDCVQNYTGGTSMMIVMTMTVLVMMLITMVMTMMMLVSLMMTTTMMMIKLMMIMMPMMLMTAVMTMRASLNE